MLCFSATMPHNIKDMTIGETQKQKQKGKSLISLWFGVVDIDIIFPKYKQSTFLFLIFFKYITNLILEIVTSEKLGWKIA